MPTHTSQTCTHRNKHGFGGFTELKDLLMPIEASDAYIWSNWVSDKAHTHTRHIQSSEEVMGADVNTLFQATRTDIIHSASLCLSVTQLPRGVKDHTFIISAGPPVRDTQKHTRTPGQHLCSLFSKEKNWDFGG